MPPSLGFSPLNLFSNAPRPAPPAAARGEAPLQDNIPLRQMTVARSSPVAGLPGELLQSGTMAKGTAAKSSAGIVTHNAPRNASHNANHLITAMQARYQDDLHKFDDIPPEKMVEAREFHENYLALSIKLKKDAASVSQAEIDQVMQQYERFFGVNWKSSTKLSGGLYQFVSHPSAVLGVIPSTMSSHTNRISLGWAAGGFAAQLIYTLLAFIPPTVMHSIVFQGQFRLADQSTKITSDKVKTRTLANSLHELVEATDEFDRLAQESTTGKTGPETSLAFRTAYQRLLAAREDCGKIEGKFNIEQKALFYTTWVRTVRAVVGMAAVITAISTGNSRNGLMVLALGTLLTMLAQVCAGFPDTSSKAGAQSRLLPRATDVVGKAEQRQLKQAQQSARVETLEAGNVTPHAAGKTAMVPARPRGAVSTEEITEIARPASDVAHAENSDDDVKAFIQTAYTELLCGQLEMRVSLLERRFELDKRKAMQDLATLYGMPNCDSYIRLQYLNGKQELNEDERKERDSLSQAFSAELPATKLTKADACREVIQRVDGDIAVLKNSNWNDALSESGKAALNEELRALSHLDKYRNITDSWHLLPTLFRAIHDGLLDLTKPEQVTPLAINKCVQVFTI